jgi:hypothetical protein
MLVVDFTAAQPIVEYLTSQVNGVRTVFTTTNAFNSVFALFMNGQLLLEGDDYTVTAPNTITFASPPRVHYLDGQAKIRVELV